MVSDTFARDRNCAASTTIDNCHAIQVHFDTGDETSRTLIVWRGKRTPLRLISKRRMRDLQPGDWVTVKGEPQRVESVELYR